MEGEEGIDYVEYTKKCLVCCTTFLTKYKNQKYCSGECGQRQYKLICETCKNPFLSIVSKRSYCSKACYRFKGICKVCKKPFTSKRYMVFCSEECKDYTPKYYPTIQEMVDNIPLNIQKNIVRLFVHKTSKEDIKEKYKKYNLTNIIIKEIVLKHGWDTIEVGKHVGFNITSKCELKHLVGGKHEKCVDVYFLGNKNNIILCSDCATNFGVRRKQIPAWYPNIITNNTNLKIELINFAKNNPFYYSKVLSKKRHRRNYGHFYSQKNNKQILFQSLLELEHIREMEEDKNIVKYDRGPRISYYDIDNDNGKCLYHVDFIIYFKNKVILVESKPLELLKVGLSNNFDKFSLIPKLEAVEEYCKNKDYIFEFWTELP